MSTKEMLLNIINEMPEEELQALLVILGGCQRRTTRPSEVSGMLSKYADPSLIEQEEGTWERTVTEQYENS